MYAAIRDEVATKPALTGPHGKAWKVDLDALRVNLAASPHDSGVAAWVIEARYAHPFWHSYNLSLIHLRPLPSSPNPEISLPGATHQFYLWALDPAHPRQSFISGKERPRALSPLNFSSQIIAASDEAASEKMAVVVQEIIDGTLNPDTDYMAVWIHRFGDNQVKLAYRDAASAARN